MARPLRLLSRSTAGGVGLILLLTACTAGGERATAPTTAASSSPPQVHFHASLVQQRTDEGTNRIDVRLTNQGKALVRVEKVHITWSGITGSSTSGTGTDYEPGRIIDIKTDFGTTVCRTEPSGEVRVEVELGSGSTVTLPIDRSGSELLRRLYDRDCALKAIAAIAEIKLSPTFTRAPGKVDRLVGSVDITRTAESQRGDRRDLAVVEVAGSILFDLTYDGDANLPLRLRPDDDYLRIPVALSVGNRCDAHALAESRATFLFSAYVRVEDHATQRVIVTPDNTVRRQASAMITRVCD